MNGFCTDDDPNTLCINDYDFESSSIIRPPDKKNSKLAQKFIFIDTDDYVIENSSLTVEFDETIKDIVEIELMSCHMPNNATFSGIDNKYLLLFIDNLDLGNYKKISKNQNVKKCFARLPITGKSNNTFFGRIKNFTNVYQFKPILQKLNKLTLRFTGKNGESVSILNDSNANNANKETIQLTFGITYQTQPDLFD